MLYLEVSNHISLESVNPSLDLGEMKCPVSKDLRRYKEIIALIFSHTLERSMTVADAGSGQSMYKT
jgi:hypothetical protein